MQFGLLESQNIITKKEIDIKKEDKQNIEEFLEQNICKLINQIMEERKIKMDNIEKIGIGSPGIVTSREIIQSPNLEIRKFCNRRYIKKTF